MYLSDFEIKLDDKGRARVPSALKDQLMPEAQNKFVINRGFNNSLRLYPLNNWKEAVAEIYELDETDPEERMYQRMFLDGHKELVMDSNDRINLPNNLMERANITNEILLKAKKSYFEIWDRATYEAYINPVDITFEDLAAKMSKKKKNLQVV
jgi:MraZ protein